MVGLLDIAGIQVPLGGVLYEAEEVAVGPDFDVVWPQQAQSAIQSIGLSMPSQFTVTNSPLTQSGTIEVTLGSSYVIPTTIEEAAWNLLVDAFTITKSGNTITNILANADLSITGDVVATGNVTAGSVGSGSGLSNAILYRLDTWEGYTSAYQDWVPAAGIVRSEFNTINSNISMLDARVTALENGSGSGGGGGTGMVYGLTMPTGFTVSGWTPQNPTARFIVGFDANYGLPTLDQLDSASLFEAIKSSDTIVGAKALYDLSIIQSGSGSTETLKNVSDILRHLEYNAAVAQVSNANITADVDFISTGNVAAGSIGTGSGISNMILYRLDDWDDLSVSTTDYVPSAGIVDARFAELETAVSGGSHVVWGTEVTDLSVILDVDGTTKNLALAAGYVKKSDYESVFNVQPTSVSLLVANNQSVRNFNVPGDIVATGNITAGAVGVESGISNYILYRLDDWAEYNLSKQDWVPSAAIVDQIRQSLPSGGFGDINTRLSNIESDISDIQDVDVAQNTAIQSIVKIIFVLPNESYPSDAQMQENTLYVKLSQTSS